MADKIAVNDENYTDLKSALEGKHEIILELLEKVIKDLQELTGKDGEFYTDAISPKVNLLCEELMMPELYGTSLFFALLLLLPVSRML